jgi:hypothetical protein
MRLFSHQRRPVHLGSYPLERLARLSSSTARPPGLHERASERPSEGIEAGPVGIGLAFAKYVALFDGLRSGAVFPVQAPSC